MNIRNVALSLLNFFVGIVEVFLGLRFILRLFGANSGNAFVSWVYDMSASLLDPFRGIFPAREIADGIVLEFNTLFAMLVYAVIGLLLMWLIAAVTPEPEATVVKKRR